MSVKTLLTFRMLTLHKRGGSYCLTADGTDDPPRTFGKVSEHREMNEAGLLLPLHIYQKEEYTFWGFFFVLKKL